MTGPRTRSRISHAEQSRETRRRIVAAATMMFLRDGYLRVTMNALAKEADVAVRTLYLSFANKTAILSAAFDVAVAGDDEPVPIVERDWYKSLASDPSGPACVANFFDYSATIIERSTPLYAVIRAASAEPEVAALLANNKRERHAALLGVAERLAQKKGFRKGLTAEDAAGIMYALSSAESYLMLVNEHGWSSRQWRRWTLATLTDQLFAATPGS